MDAVRRFAGTRCGPHPPGGENRFEITGKSGANFASAKLNEPRPCGARSGAVAGQRGDDMHPAARKLFFTDRVEVKNSLGTSFEMEGLFLNWFGRNVPFVALAVWAGFMLVFAL